MKHLPKHIRPRWRYLAVEIEAAPDAEIDRTAFQRALWYAAGNLLGDAGSADVDLSVVDFGRTGSAGWAIVRTRRDEVERARAALACVDAVDGDPVGLRVTGTSGTIRACEEKYIRRPAEATGRRTVTFEGADRTAVLRNGRADVGLDSGFLGATTDDFE